MARAKEKMNKRRAPSRTGKRPAVNLQANKTFGSRTDVFFPLCFIGIDGIQYGGATVAFLGPTHRFLCSHSVYVRDSDVLMF